MVTTRTCPRCRSPLAPASSTIEAPKPGSCPTCKLGFLWRGGLIDVLGKDEREERAAEVESFYTKSPFPGYAADDDGPAILDRCRKNPFTESMHRAIPADADVLDIGTGTAQIPAYLALAGPRRRVFGVDGCRMSLTHAEEFRARAKLDNLQLVRGDIFDLPVEPGSFPVVLSRGVVHHTPDPDLAIAKVAACVALFDPSSLPGPAGLFLRRLGWMATGLNNPDAGLVCVVARRQDRV